MRHHTVWEIRYRWPCGPRRRSTAAWL